MASKSKMALQRELLSLNPHMSDVGQGDVWMGEPGLIPLKKGRALMVNMTVKLPFGARLVEANLIERDGVQVKIWRP